MKFFDFSSLQEVILARPLASAVAIKHRRR